MSKYYICILPEDKLTVGTKYVSHQPEPGDVGYDDFVINDARNWWVNVVDDSGFIHPHSKDKLMPIEEFRQDRLNKLLDGKV